MNFQRTIAILLFTTSALLWGFVYYAVYILPKKLAIWEEEGTALPTLTAFFVEMSQVLQQSVIWLLLLAFMTIGSVVWYVVAKRPRVKTFS